MTTANIQEEKKRVRKPKPRPAQVVIGALDENALMLIRDPHSESIGLRISELLSELSRSLSGGKADDDDV